MHLDDQEIIIENNSTFDQLQIDNIKTDDKMMIFIDQQNDSQMQAENDNQNKQSLTPCTICQRKFLSDRLEKHLIICQKIKEKKRKLFDAAKQRAENLDKINGFVPTEINVNNEHATNVGKSKNNSKNSTTKSDNSQTNNKKQSNWRQQHQEFIRTIRAARGVTSNIDDGDDLNNQTNNIPSGFVECPTCGRKFSNKAADRHIEWCAESKRKQNERNQQNSNSNNNNNQDAFERMKARTKYKPTKPGKHSNNNSNSKSDKNKNDSLVRSKSITTLSSTGSTISSTSSQSSTTIRSTSQNNLRQKQPMMNKKNNSIINKNVKSKSSENLNTNVENNKNFKSPTISRRTIVLRKNQNNKPKSIKKYSTTPTPPATTLNMSKISSKIDSGINPDRNQSRNTNHEKSAPIMKFKEKFPNHHMNSNAKTIIDKFQDIEHILRRNSMAIYDDSPKTVPGVRTGGISPMTKLSNNNRSNSISNNNNNDNINHINNDHKSNILSKSETNLQMMGGDIKKRIDQYINSLYDNQIWSTSKNNNGGNVFTNGGGIGQQPSQSNHMNNQRQQNPHHHPSIVDQSSTLIRQNSANSDEARMSTSDSTDSGLGVVIGNYNATGGINGFAHQLLETVDESDINIIKSRQSNRSGSKISRHTFRADLIDSPTMSDVESSTTVANQHLLLRNSSLNDIELNDNFVNMNDNSMHKIIETENRPKFCHQCGTKYPNMMAKFCYECGSRRFETVA